ncbi:MAG: diacylglycerol/lipid kinase family protein [Solirubrobacterales bacterium]
MPPTIAPARSETSPAAPAVPLTPGAAKKRMLIIVNPYATTVSDRLKNLVVYALQARYEVEAVDTEAAEHAIEIGREARNGGYDIVVAFGGDGTLSEVANGLAGTDVPVSVLPGGSTNVVCRTLGIPNDVVDATEHLIGIADDFRPRKIDLGRCNGRHFVFACGVGLDATVVKRVDAHPRLKARARQWYYTWAAISGFYRHYLRDPVRLELEIAGESHEGVTAIAQNTDPFTYFANLPIRICEDIEYDDGTLAMALLERAKQRDMLPIAARVLSRRFHTSRHRKIHEFDDVGEAMVRSISMDEEGQPRPFPVQVDGDYIGEYTELRFSVDPAALTVVS